MAQYNLEAPSESSERLNYASYIFVFIVVLWKLSIFELLYAFLYTKCLVKTYWIVCPIVLWMMSGIEIVGENFG